MASRTFLPPIPEQHFSPLGFRIWHSSESARMRFAHTHSDIEVNFLFSGSMTYLYGGSVVTVEPLRFTVLWGGVPHCALTSSIRREGIWMTLPLAWFLMWKLPNNLTARLFGGEILSPPPEAGDRLQLERWLEDFTSGGAERRRVLLLEIEARFHRLALASPRRSRSIRGGKPLATGLDHVERITDYIAAHYQEPMSVGQIARALGFHEKYLMRLFRRHSRMCIWEYVTRMRLAHAQRLLLTSDMKILDIALDSGFASLGPFYRAFAAYSPGLPRPRDYRQRMGAVK